VRQKSGPLKFFAIFSATVCDFNIKFYILKHYKHYLRQGGNVLPDFVCLFVCRQDNSKSYGQIFLKFSGNVGNGNNYQWFNFGRDPKKFCILDHFKIFVTIALKGA